MKWRAKFSDAISISTISTASIAGEPKYAMLRSWVEKPPSPTAEKAWQMASNHDMPPMRSAAMPARVRSEEHTSELQSPCNLVCRLLLEKKKHHQREHTMTY